MFCEKCGRMIDSDDAVCPLCGTTVKELVSESAPILSEEQTEYKKSAHQIRENTAPTGTVSRFTAGFLQIFLGSLGIGRFYMGYTGIGIAQIAATFLTCGIGGFIWGFVDGIIILCGSARFDAKGREFV